MDSLKSFYYNEDLFDLLQAFRKSNFFLFYPNFFLSVFSYALVFFLKVNDFKKFDKLFIFLDNFFINNNIKFLKFSNYHLKINKFFFFNKLGKVDLSFNDTVNLSNFDILLCLDNKLLFRYVYDFFSSFFNFKVFDFLGVKFGNRFLNLSEILPFLELKLINLNKVWLNRYFFFLLSKHINCNFELSADCIVNSPLLNYMYIFKSIIFFVSNFKFNFCKMSLFFNRTLFLFYAYFKSTVK